MDGLTGVLERYAGRLAVLAILVVLLLLFWSLGQTLRQLYEDVYMAEPAQVVQQVTREAPAPKVPDAADISQLNLFGAPEPEQAPVEVEAPETHLDLVLEGVFVSANPNASTAIIAAGRQAGELFYPGELLPGDAVLTAVQEDQVLLTRGGVLETLRFEEAEPGENEQIVPVHRSDNP